MMRFVFCIALSSAANALSGKTIAITGSTGRLGRRAVERVVAAGFNARALVRHDADAALAPAADGSGAEVARWLRDDLGAELVRGDVRGSVNSCARAS